jgi:anionic cell wall polymer biosynthesis LytR-Cps2A-Psr (LCP) family protein
MTMVDPAFRKGVTLTLTDKQAEQFVRARMSLPDDRNTERMRRQRVFMTAFQNQVVRMSAGDPTVFLKLYRRMSKKGVTNISARKMAEISAFVYKNKSRGILTYSGKQKLGKLDYDPTPHAMFFANRKSIRKGLNTLCGVKR